MADKNGGSGGTFDPSATGAKFGKQIDYYLDNPLRFGEPLYTSPGGTTKSGYDQMRSILSGPAGQGLENSYNYASNLIANNGYAPQSRPTRESPMVPQTPAIGSTTHSTPMVPSAEMTANGYGGQGGGGGGGSLTEQTLLRSAMGGNLGGQDPNFKALQDRTAASMSADLSGALGSIGRGGADNLLVDQLAEQVGGMRLQSNENERMYQDQLQRGDLAAIEGQRQQAVGNALSAGDRMSSRFADLMAPGRSLLEIGGAEDADVQAKQLDRYDTWKRTETPGYNQLLELLGAFNSSSGSPGLKEEVPWWQQLMGYIAGNAGTAARTLAGQ